MPLFDHQQHFWAISLDPLAPAAVTDDFDAVGYAVSLLLPHAVTPKGKLLQAVHYAPCAGLWGCPLTPMV